MWTKKETPAAILGAQAAKTGSGKEEIVRRHVITTDKGVSRSVVGARW